tara:strand:- start:294 stop:554 length:261 start_codon:yes stop_codon:yes gene_type:complete
MGALSPQKQNLPSWANNGITGEALQNLPATYQTPSDEFTSGVQGFLDNKLQAQFSSGSIQAAQGMYGTDEQKLAATRGSGTSAGVL